MPSLNKVFLMGNLTRDPELRHTPGGTVVCEFGLAVNRTYTSKDGEKREDVCFVDVTAWGKTGSLIAEYCSKGKPLFIEGRLKLEQWETADGRRSKLKVVAENFQFIGGPRPDHPKGDAAPQAAREEAPLALEGEDDLAPADGPRGDGRFDVSDDEIPF